MSCPRTLTAGRPLAAVHSIHYSRKCHSYENETARTKHNRRAISGNYHVSFEVQRRGWYIKIISFSIHFTLNFNFNINSNEKVFFMEIDRGLIAHRDKIEMKRSTLSLVGLLQWEKQIWRESRNCTVLQEEKKILYGQSREIYACRWT